MKIILIIILSFLVISETGLLFLFAKWIWGLEKNLKKNDDYVRDVFGYLTHKGILGHDWEAYFKRHYSKNEYGVMEKVVIDIENEISKEK